VGRLLFSSNKRGWSSLYSALVFVMHQFIGTLGIIWFATISVALLGGTIAELYDLVGRQFSKRPIYWIMTETPYFPVQIALGFYCGWKIYRRLRHREALWVWVPPLLVLCYAVVAIPTSGPQMTSIFIQLGGQSPLSHYFGWGCQPKNGCFDQLLITLPFYTATAYSIGACLGMRKTGASCR
jgi:hypothetical protein